MSAQGNEEKTDFKKNLDVIMRNKNPLQGPKSNINQVPSNPIKPTPFQTSVENDQIKDESIVQNIQFKGITIPEVPKLPISNINNNPIPIIPQVPGFPIPSSKHSSNNNPTENVACSQEIPKVQVPKPIPIPNKIPQVPGIPLTPMIPAPIFTQKIPQIPGVPKPPMANNIPQIPGIPKIPNIGAVPMPPVNNLNHMPGVPTIPGIPGVSKIPNAINFQIPTLQKGPVLIRIFSYLNL